MPILGCGCHANLSRRHVLQAGVGTVALGAASLARDSLAQTAAASGSVVDIHAHYFPQPWLDLVAADGKRFGADYIRTPQGFIVQSPFGRNGPLPSKFIDLKERLADMDAQGVTVHALSLTSPMLYWADAELSHKLARAFNDGASEAHKRYPDRLVGLMALPMLDAERSVAEIERAGKLPGIRGVYMGTNINGKDLDDPQFEPIFKKVEELGLPVFLHPLQTIGGERTKPYYLANLLGNPFDSTVAAAHLIFGGVLDRHPKLEINLPHAGGALPILIGRMDHGYKVRKEARHLPQPPSAYLKRFTYDTISHSEPILKFLVTQVGAERIMVGSDYCFDMGYERPVEIVEALGLQTPDRDMILGGTASRLLKL
jgi:aminocarboxymuconate-semialdehyde decarboxylase